MCIDSVQRMGESGNTAVLYIAEPRESAPCNISDLGLYIVHIAPDIHHCSPFVQSASIQAWPTLDATQPFQSPNLQSLEGVNDGKR